MSAMSLLGRSERFLRERLPVLSEGARSAVFVQRQRVWDSVTCLARRMQRHVEVFRLRSGDLPAEANRILNEVTGYEECERLRLAVKAADLRFRRVKEDLRQSRLAFAAAIDSRHHCQKELNTLLQRKQSWHDEDLVRFTDLYRTEMRLEQAEADAKAANELLETQVDDAHQDLMDSVRERYQEEQLWSDKIRRLSTFGTFSLMGLNLLLFLLLQLYVEPAKRRTFIANFERAIDSRLAAVQSALDAVAATATASAAAYRDPALPGLAPGARPAVPLHVEGTHEVAPRPSDLAHQYWLTGAASAAAGVGSVLFLQFVQRFLS